MRECSLPGASMSLVLLRRRGRLCDNAGEVGTRRSLRARLGVEEHLRAERLVVHEGQNASAQDEQSSLIGVEHGAGEVKAGSQPAIRASRVEECPYWDTEGHGECSELVNRDRPVAALDEPDDRARPL